MADITMPQLGETVTEGTIIRWLKGVGDAVKQDEPLFEVSTDKVDSEVPSPAAGILTEILVQEGQTVDVGSRLAVVGDGAGAEQATTAPPAQAPPAAEPAAAAPQAAAPPPPPAPEPAPAPVQQAAPPPPPPQPAPAPVQQAAPQPVASPTPTANGNRATMLSPVVRRLVAEHGLDLSAIPGTGMGGRITREDVLGFIDRQPSSAAAPVQTEQPAPQNQAEPPAAQSPPAVQNQPAAQNQMVAAAPSAPSTSAPVHVPAAPSAAPSQVQAPSAGAVPLGVRDEVIPFSAIRRVTAEHMVRSKATSAHTLVAIEVDFENVEKVRRANREHFQAEEGMHLTYLPFISRAVIDTLRNYPNLNSSVGNDALIVHKDVHLGIAVDLGLEGLMVPVIHNADGQSLRGLARSIVDLAGRARSRALAVNDISGGTFTITNPGPYGTFMTVPIIAQPQVAILSSDGVKRKPVVVTNDDGSEAIAIHSVGVLALSFDHRAVDGAYAASFMRDVATVLQTRDWSAEL